MDFLKKIPIKYIGELHDVRLVNFTVELDEIKSKVPHLLRVRNFKGRALISMVDVKLKNMHPSFVPSLFHFNYRHIAFRLLVEDSVYNNGTNKGLFFYRSFTDKPLIVAGGNLLTDYNLERARITEKENDVELFQNGKYVKYSIENPMENPGEQMNSLKEVVGALDRAYSVSGNRLRVTQIQREKWPIQPVDCISFENTFFDTAKLEGAFRVFETIYYQWLPSKNIPL